LEEEGLEAKEKIIGGGGGEGRILSLMKVGKSVAPCISVFHGGAFSNKASNKNS